MEAFSEDQLGAILLLSDIDSLSQAVATSRAFHVAAANNDALLWEGLVTQLADTWNAGTTEDLMIAYGGAVCPKPEFDGTLISVKEKYRLMRYFKRHRVPSLPDALRAAADKNHQMTLRVLLKAKADPNAMADTGAHGVGFTNVGAFPLHLAAKRSHLKVLDILLDARADVDAVDQNGRTGLMVATASGQRAAAEWLVSQSASLDLASHYGYTALHYAAQLPRPPLVEVLLQAGAAPNAVDREGQTPLHLALNSTRRRVTQKPQTSFDPSGGDGDEYCYTVDSYQGIGQNDEQESEQDKAVKATVSSLLEYNASTEHRDGQDRKPIDILRAKNRGDLCTWFEDQCTKQEQQSKPTNSSPKRASSRSLPSCFGYLPCLSG
mmetsp:Transcript_128000/g.239510  ORF Transcript_128000/g.239510 Transcript_128000/m.239510 type:complete len:379 (+) Transcript_128000:88-1224(+)